VEEISAATPAKRTLTFATENDTSRVVVPGEVSVIKNKQTTAPANEWFDEVSVYTEGDDATGVVVAETTTPALEEQQTSILESIKKSLQQLSAVKSKTFFSISTNTTPSLVRNICYEEVKVVTDDEEGSLPKLNMAAKPAYHWALVTILVVFLFAMLLVNNSSYRQTDVVEKAPLFKTLNFPEVDLSELMTFEKREFHSSVDRSDKVCYL